MFNYAEVTPQSNFSNYIRKFWVLDNLNHPLISEGRYTLPNGCFTIAFISGQGIIWENNAGTKHIGDGIYLVGQTTKRLKVSLMPYTKAIMVQFNPWAISLVTNLPLNEITDQYADFRDVNNAAYLKFTDADKLDVNAIEAKCYDVFGSFFNNSAANSTLIQALCLRLSGDLLNPSLKMNDVANYAGYSKRYIEKKFNDHIGMAPQSFRSILRMRSLVNELDKDKSFAEVYYKYGYYDQSHFIKSYSKIMDSRPTKFDSHQYIFPFSNKT